MSNSIAQLSRHLSTQRNLLLSRRSTRREYSRQTAASCSRAAYRAENSYQGSLNEVRTCSANFKVRRSLRFGYRLYCIVNDLGSWNELLTRDRKKQNSGFVLHDINKQTIMKHEYLANFLSKYNERLVYGGKVCQLDVFNSILLTLQLASGVSFDDRHICCEREFSEGT